ncbi:MAG TPA: neutral/alkaline non-lysosomal ceramidase N-terminal domain-containing protein [Methylomirabilota bacterium]|nr:neutral/alkaline non-lysosomal ceramidase N-terminal domain-containing protein [Methylomirabilota bacterium]
MSAGRGPALALLVVLLLALLPRPAAAQACPDCLEAGAARVSLRVPEGAPLAGYGSLARRLWLPDVFGRYPHAFWFKPSEGERDPLAARALVLESAGVRVALAAVDLLAVDRAFTTDVERRLGAAGVRPVTLVLAASHTHSGPGAYVDSALLGWLVMDRLDKEIRDALVDGVVAAVRQADAVRVPARVAAGVITAPPLTVSRLGQPLDAELLTLKVTRPGGAPVALLWNYAIHGTMLGAGNLKLSADIMGDTTAVLERELGVPALFLNGAVGDVSPRHHGDRASRDIGVNLAAAVRQGWESAASVGRPALRTAGREVALPAPRLSVKNCVGGWAPAALRLPLGSVFPRTTVLTALAVGDTALVTAPGELQTKLGLSIKQAGHARFARTLVAGLANDYLGYFVTAADYPSPGYVTCSTLYGPRTGECLTGAAIELLAGLARGERTGRAACDRG